MYFCGFSFIYSLLFSLSTWGVICFVLFSLCIFKSYCNKYKTVPLERGFLQDECYYIPNRSRSSQEESGGPRRNGIGSNVLYVEKLSYTIFYVKWSYITSVLCTITHGSFFYVWSSLYTIWDFFYVSSLLLGILHKMILMYIYVLLWVHLL